MPSAVHSLASVAGLRGDDPRGIIPSMEAGNIRTLPERRTLASAVRYLERAIFLRCPLCGVSPIFQPLRETRTLYRWITPLDGCPRCNYPYEREPGYFLLAIFAFNYGAVLVLGLGLWAAYEWFLDLTVGETLLWTMLPMALTSVLVVRHSKALFLAMDLWVDPVRRGR